MKRILICLLSALMTCSIGIISASAVHPDNSTMQNDYLTLYVGTDSYDLGRYQLAANKGDIDNNSDDGKGLTYENFYSSYTTIVINGQARRFGEGETVSEPTYDASQKISTTVQRFGDVEVTQTLRFADGLGSGHEDMLLISYTTKNLSEQDVLVGVRILLDSELGKDDGGKLYVDGTPLTFEKTYDDNLPSEWSVVSSDESVTAIGKVTGGPDRVIFANWDTLYNKKWGYSLNSSEDITDSAAAVVWDNRALSAGESREYSVYYGVKNKKEQSSDPDTSKPEDTSKPDDTSNPEDTSKPDDTSNPEDTSKPDDTSNPEDSSKPDNASNPENTSRPDDTSKPEDTSKPQQTSVNRSTETSQQISVAQPSEGVGTGDTGTIAGLMAALTASFAGIALFRKKKGGSDNE